MVRVKIHDSAFTPFALSASLREDNVNVPSPITWVNPDEEADSTAVFYTDGHIKDVQPGENNIAWLLEPPHLRPENYQTAYKLHDRFKYVVTYDKRLIDRIPNGRFYPFGGSSIAFDEKSRSHKMAICMFVSDKKQTDGHKLRHEIAKRFSHVVDLYGAGVGKPIARKKNVLSHYRFCIVVESGRCDYYFTEKLIDCLVMGVVPIYWGCPHIERFFNQSGIIKFDGIEQLDKILNSGITFNSNDYAPFATAVVDNYYQAVKYRICEHYLMDYL